MFYSNLFLFFSVCSHLPLSSTWRLTLSPTCGDSLHFLFFPFVTNYHLISFVKYFSSLPSFILFYSHLPLSMVLHSCPSFLNEVMASEPLFEERSDAVKVSETLCLLAKVSAELTKGASVSRNEKSSFYGMTLNICLSFLNEVKNLAKDTRFKYSNLCTHTCPYRLAWLGTSLRMRGKLTLRRKEIIFLKCITWLLP